MISFRLMVHWTRFRLLDSDFLPGCIGVVSACARSVTRILGEVIQVLEFAGHDVENIYIGYKDFEGDTLNVKKDKIDFADLESIGENSRAGFAFFFPDSNTVTGF